MRQINKLVLIVLGFVIVQTLNSLIDILSYILLILSTPFTFLVEINIDKLNSIGKWGLLIIYILLYWGLIQIGTYLWLRYKRNNEPTAEIGETISLLCESELSELINSIDAKEPQDKIRDSTVRLLKEFERGVTRMFELNKGEYKCLWGFPSDQDDNVCILAIENEVMKEELEIFEWALGSKKHRFYSNDIHDNFEGIVQEMAFARNLGEFRLGFAILIYKNGVVTQSRRQMFKTASSYLLLLGHIDKLTQEMVQLYQE